MRHSTVTLLFLFIVLLYPPLSIGNDSKPLTDHYIDSCPKNFSYTQRHQLGSIRAVKWKQKLPVRGGKYHDMVYGVLARPLQADGSPVSFERIASKLSDIGVQSVAFRIDSRERYIDINGNGSYDEMVNYHKELVLAIRALEKQNIDVYLFARIWLNKHSDDDVVKRFGLYLNNLKTEDLSMIDGVALTEVHLDDFDELKRRAVRIVKKINSRYDNWLKSRGFIMPGLDNGFRFTGIKRVDDFHDVISNEVGQFSFSIKYMRLNDRHDPGRLYDEFYKIKSASNISYKSAYNTYVKYGLNDLFLYQSNTDNKQVSHIVFWGDSGDSLLNTPPRAVQLFRQFVQEYNFSQIGAFIYQVTTDSDSSLRNSYDRQLIKSLLIYDRDKDEFVTNDIESGVWKGVIGTYNQWECWFEC